MPSGRAARRPAGSRGGRDGQPLGRRVARPLACVPPRSPAAEIVESQVDPGAAPTSKSGGFDMNAESREAAFPADPFAP